MRILIVLLALLLAASTPASSQVFGKKKSKEAPAPDPKIDSLTKANQTLTLKADSLSGELAKHMGAYAVIKEKVFHYDYDPAKMSFLLDSLRSSRDTTAALLSGKAASDSIAMLLKDKKLLQSDLDSIKAKDLLPFKRLIAEGLEAVMPAHVVFAAVDDKPAGFSPFWIQKILREELQFNGAVFSDDLSMAGASWAGGYPERANMALAAGCDMVLVCNNPTAAEQVLEALPIQKQPLREIRLAAMRGNPQFNRENLLNSVQWRQISDKINHTFYSC